MSISDMPINSSTIGNVTVDNLKPRAVRRKSKSKVKDNDENVIQAGIAGVNDDDFA